MLALSVACTAAAVTWAYLVFGHGGYWRTGQRLPPPGGPSRGLSRGPSRGPSQGPSGGTAGPLGWPDVVSVIPARNEAAMLPAVLPTLLGQDYPGALTVILVDDCSTDGTAEIAARLGPEPGHPGRALRVVAGAPLPSGWAGKVWAMAQGLAAASAAGAAGADGADGAAGAAGQDRERRIHRGGETVVGVLGACELRHSSRVTAPGWGLGKARVNI
jgi:cellulose synthase/poly-beta-1,6-N-acetylglucosamine synthase-like glycosyltransferase